MERTRKLIMRCEHATPCDLCFTDCKRAEITAKENKIRSDLLAACKTSFKQLVIIADTLGLPKSPQLDYLEAAIAQALCTPEPR